MKKAPILVIACLASHILFAQQSLKFSVKYLPLQNYATSFKMDMDMTMNIADETMAKAMKDAGQPSSMLMKMNMATVFNMATKAQTANKDVPFTIIYNDVSMSGSMNGQSLPLPDAGLKGFGFFGHYSNQTKKVGIDGIQGDTVNAEKKAAAETQLSQIFNQYSFPDTTLKIGDKFVQNVPMSVPTAAGNAEVITKVTYILKEIKANQAIFDLNQVVDMTMNIPQAGGDMTMKGTGTGSMVYDIAAKFPINTNIAIDLAFKMNAGGAPLSGNMKGVSITDVKVTKK
nr:hypothetical protein [uncultured Mucilaginibacter sp.]